MVGTFEAITWQVAILALYMLTLVVLVDLVAWLRGSPSVTQMIRTSWLCWPVGALAALVVGVIVLAHFIRLDLPGQ